MTPATKRKKDKQGLCYTLRCRGKKPKPPKDGRQRNYCHKCTQRKKRSKNRKRAAFDNLRNSADKRGKRFVLTLDEWLNWSELDRYMKYKGRGNNSLTVDCIVNDVGYDIGNIQLLTFDQNRRKGNK